MDAIEAGDYVLGTGDTEIARLSLQHRVWRTHATAAWTRAGFRAGHRILDAGAGPGFATLDLAELAGPSGQVVAVERATHFIAALDSARAARGLSTIQIVEGDLDRLAIDEEAFDGVWCRWVLAFVADPRHVLGKLARALAPGGSIAIHEYFDYGTWRTAPRCAELDEFVRLVIHSWRESGGEPDIGLNVPAWLEELGLRVRSVRPVVEVAQPGDPFWEWPMAFVHAGTARLVELGTVNRERADAILAAVARAGRERVRMITPGVLEIVAARV